MLYRIADSSTFVRPGVHTLSDYLSYLDSRPRKVLYGLIAILLAAIGGIDYITGVEISIVVFYLLPVTLAAWFLGRWNGVGVSIIAAIVWYLADLSSSPSYSAPIVPYWNALVMLGSLLSTSLVLAQLRQTTDRELQLSREIQERLLPGNIPEIKGFEIAAAWRPARSVSGDYYDIILVDHEHVALCIGDVVGHGFPAALLMSNLQAAVRMLAASNASPAKICTELNKFMFSNTTREKFITFFIGLLDIRTRGLVYSNAGHNRPILVHSSGEQTTLPQGSAALGLVEGASYSDWKIGLAEGDMLVVFTDGALEAINLQREQFGEERFLSVVNQSYELGARFTCDSLLRAVLEFSNGIVYDDVALLALSVLPAKNQSDDSAPVLVQKGSHEDTTGFERGALEDVKT